MEGIETIGETSDVKAFDAALRETDLYPLKAEDITTFQVNVGRLCNQSWGLRGRSPCPGTRSPSYSTG